MATLLSIGIILWVGSRPAQLFFQAARERMTAQNPPATIGDLGRERGACLCPLGRVWMGPAWLKYNKRQKDGYLVGLLVSTWQIK